MGDTPKIGPRGGAGGVDDPMLSTPRRRRRGRRRKPERKDEYVGTVPRSPVAGDKPTEVRLGIHSDDPMLSARRRKRRSAKPERKRRKRRSRRKRTEVKQAEDHRRLLESRIDTWASNAVPQIVISEEGKVSVPSIPLPPWVKKAALDLKKFAERSIASMDPRSLLIEKGQTLAAALAAYWTAVGNEERTKSALLAAKAIYDGLHYGAELHNGEAGARIVDSSPEKFNSQVAKAGDKEKLEMSLHNLLGAIINITHSAHLDDPLQRYRCIQRVFRHLQRAEDLLPVDAVELNRLAESIRPILTSVREAFEEEPDSPFPVTAAGTMPPEPKPERVVKPRQQPEPQPPEYVQPFRPLDGETARASADTRHKKLADDILAELDVGYSLEEALKKSLPHFWKGLDEYTYEWHGKETTWINSLFSEQARKRGYPDIELLYDALELLKIISTIEAIDDRSQKLDSVLSLEAGAYADVMKRLSSPSKIAYMDVFRRAKDSIRGSFDNLMSSFPTPVPLLTDVKPPEPEPQEEEIDKLSAAGEALVVSMAKDLPKGDPAKVTEHVLNKLLAYWTERGSGRRNYPLLIAAARDRLNDSSEAGPVMKSADKLDSIRVAKDNPKLVGAELTVVQGLHDLARALVYVQASKKQFPVPADRIPLKLRGISHDAAEMVATRFAYALSTKIDNITDEEAKVLAGEVHELYAKFIAEKIAKRLQEMDRETVASARPDELVTSLKVELDSGLKRKIKTLVGKLKGYGVSRALRGRAKKNLSNSFPGIVSRDVATLLVQRISDTVAAMELKEKILALSSPKTALGAAQNAQVLLATAEVPKEIKELSSITLGSIVEQIEFFTERLPDFEGVDAIFDPSFSMSNISINAASTVTIPLADVRLLLESNRGKPSSAARKLIDRVAAKLNETKEKSDHIDLGMAAIRSALVDYWKTRAMMLRADDQAVIERPYARLIEVTRHYTGNNLGQLVQEIGKKKYTSPLNWADDIHETAIADYLRVPMNPVEYRYMQMFHALVRADIYRRMPLDYHRFNDGIILDTLDIIERQGVEAVGNARMLLKGLGAPRAIVNFVGDVDRALQDRAAFLEMERDKRDTESDETAPPGTGESRVDMHRDEMYYEGSIETSIDPQDYRLPTLPRVLTGRVTKDDFLDYIEKVIAPLDKEVSEVEGNETQLAGNAAWFLRSIIESPGEPGIEFQLITKGTFDAMGSDKREPAKKKALYLWAAFRVGGMKFESRLSKKYMQLKRFIRFFGLMGWKVQVQGQGFVPAIGKEKLIFQTWSANYSPNMLGEINFARVMGMDGDEVEEKLQRLTKKTGGDDRNGGGSPDPTKPPPIPSIANGKSPPPVPSQERSARAMMTGYIPAVFTVNGSSMQGGYATFGI